MTSPQEPQPAPADRGRLVPLLIDTLLAAACYLSAYRIRFAGPLFDEFLPYALKTMPTVVISQMAALVLVRVYGRKPTRVILSRILVGSMLGSLVAGALVWLLQGLTGVSRAAFTADFVLFTIAAMGWRAGHWLLRQSRITTGPQTELVDRTTERATLADTLVALVRYRELVRNLVAKDLKLKYRGSVLGFLWSLLNPLVMIGVYTFAFTYVMPTRVEAFVFFLLLGILAWNFFATAATMSTGAIIDSGSLMKSVSFPRAILPIAIVLFTLTQYLLTILVFLPVMALIYRVPPSLPMVLFPVFLALQVIFTIGVALLISAGTAFFRDIRHLLEIGLAALFWMTPIIYPLARVHEKLRMLVLLTPLSPFIVAYQEMFYYRQWPSLTVWIIAVAYALGTFLVGAWFFLSVEDRLPEQL